MCPGPADEVEVCSLDKRAEVPVARDERMPWSTQLRAMRASPRLAALYGYV
jgi:hypothetical protein